MAHRKSAVIFPSAPMMMAQGGLRHHCAVKKRVMAQCACPCLRYTDGKGGLHGRATFEWRTCRGPHVRARSWRREGDGPVEETGVGGFQPEHLVLGRRLPK